MIVAEHIERGAWIARHLGWVVGLQQREDGWEARLLRWPVNRTPIEVDVKRGFDCAKSAVRWAAELLSDRGVAALLNDGERVLTLVDLLRFSPTPAISA